LKNQTNKQLQHALVALSIVMPIMVACDVAMLALDEDPVPAPTPRELAILKAEQCIHWNHYGLPTGEYGACPGKLQPGWFLR
jgi:hypothetical protein